MNTVDFDNEYKTTPTRIVKCGIDYVVSNYSGHEVVLLGDYNKYGSGSQRSNAIKGVCFDILNQSSAEDIANAVYNKEQSKDKYDMLISFDHVNANAIYSPQFMLDAKLESYDTCVCGYTVLEELEKVIQGGLLYNHPKSVEIKSLITALAEVEYNLPENVAQRESFQKFLDQLPKK